MKNYQLSVIICLFLACSSPQSPPNEEITTTTDYLDFSQRDDQFSGGIKMIPITTAKGDFKVWTKRVGNNPDIKVLLLHGGPGLTHELYQCFDGYLPQEGIEYIYYDQLGSYYSDQPDDNALWTTERFVEEVEQVRQALNLDQTNFYLFGQSWGGLLAMEYALKYQDNLKGLIISNMMASAPDYNQYAKDVLAPQLDPEVYTEIKEIEENEDFENPRYAELLFEHHYTQHVLRMPLDKWPEAINRTLKHLNPNVYVFMQGYSELGITGDATLKDWEVKSELSKIAVPTLVVGSEFDTMDPKHMEWISTEVQNGRYLHCPNGSHLVQYDDQKTFFSGLIKYLREVDQGVF